MLTRDVCASYACKFAIYRQKNLYVLHGKLNSVDEILFKAPAEKGMWSLISALFIAERKHLFHAGKCAHYYLNMLSN
jgi:hypothetical protein